MTNDYDYDYDYNYNYNYNYNYPFGLQLIANSQNGGKNSFFMRTLCLL